MKINALNLQYEAAIKNKIDQKTKPQGSLGLLENTALQLALIQSNKAGKLISTIEINQPSVIVFAGDHGISEAGVSIAPSSVTRQMVQNFIAGGAAINCFCRVNKLNFYVVDAGIIKPIIAASPAPSNAVFTNSPFPNSTLLNMRLGAGTHNFVIQSAMSTAQVKQGLAYGEAAVKPLIENGTNLLILGEMGIGNTSSAAAIMARLTHYDVDICVGTGTGISAEQLSKKKRLIEQALLRFTSDDPHTVLQEVGGFEIVEITGAILAAANAGICVLIDGFIISTAALVACKIAPNVREYLIFAHESNEFGHQLLLNYLQAKPLLRLGLRLGEGTGAVIALPLLQSAAEFYNNMASFEDAGINV